MFKKHVYLYARIFDTDQTETPVRNRDDEIVDDFDALGFAPGDGLAAPPLSLRMVAWMAATLTESVSCCPCVCDICAFFIS